MLGHNKVKNTKNRLFESEIRTRKSVIDGDDTAIEAIWSYNSTTLNQSDFLTLLFVASKHHQRKEEEIIIRSNKWKYVLIVFTERIVDSSY